MIKDFLIINCTGKNDKIGLRVNTNFYVHDFQTKIQKNDILTLIIFYLLNTLIFKKENPVNKIIILFPILTFLTFFINSLFIIYKGSPQLKLDELPFWICFLISLGIATFTAVLSRYIYVPYVKKKINIENNNTENEVEENVVDTNEVDMEIEIGNRSRSYVEASNNIELEIITNININRDKKNRASDKTTSPIFNKLNYLPSSARTLHCSSPNN